MSDSTTSRATIVDHWHRQVSTRPHDPALRWRAECYTFGELGRLVDAVAGWLPSQGLEPGDIVATTLPRSAEAIITQLAIVQAGMVHLAINPQGPVERTSAILRDAEPALVFDSAMWQPATNDAKRSQRRPAIDLSSAAYLVYTSGSSGPPKGVLVEHRSLANLFSEHERHLFPLAAQTAGRPRTRVAHAIALSFDAAWDPLLWLVAGHELYLLPDDIRGDVARLAEAIAEHGLDVVELTPGLAEQLAQRGLFQAPHAPSLFLTGGEAVGQGLWTELAAAPHTVAINLYGPTECTVFATWARIDRFPSPVLGYPIVGTDCRVVDADGRSLPDGEVGELLLSGACVARGYHNRAELTGERFVTIPGAGGPRRSYRTGDQVRRLPSGALEFHGRTDRQVKVRGHRIELGDVETTLLAHHDVHQAVVKLRDEGGSADLVAYVIGAEHGTPAQAELTEFTAERLPQVMIPAAFVHLDELPLTPHGKVDHAALALPPRAAAATPFDAPRGELEILLGKEFCAILKLDRIGRNDSFFELGGHSLLAAVVAENLRRAGVTCSLLDIMDNPRVADLAAQLDFAWCEDSIEEAG
jgi:amino acid adenylation domain-containing protein